MDRNIATRLESWGVSRDAVPADAIAVSIAMGLHIKTRNPRAIEAVRAGRIPKALAGTAPNRRPWVRVREPNDPYALGAPAEVVFNCSHLEPLLVRCGPDLDELVGWLDQHLAEIAYRHHPSGQERTEDWRRVQGSYGGFGVDILPITAVHARQHAEQHALARSLAQRLARDGSEDY